MIEAPVVDTKAERAVLFLDKQDRGTTGGLRRVDEPLREVLLYPCREFFEFLFGEGV